MLSDSLYLIISSIFIQNLVLTHFLGLCPFLGVSNKMQTAIGMGIATAFVLTLSSTAAYMLSTYLLVPYELEYLRTITYITIVAALVGLTETLIRNLSPLLHRILGLYLPLITSNCAVLGVMLISTREQYSLIHAALYGVGAAIGFSGVLILFAAIRERLTTADIPAPFKGTPIAMITAGIMAIAFMGFHGL